MGKRENSFEEFLERMASPDEFKSLPRRIQEALVINTGMRLVPLKIVIHNIDSARNSEVLYSWYSCYFNQRALLRKSCRELRRTLESLQRSLERGIPGEPDSEQ